MPVLNKVDLPASDLERTKKQIEDVIGIDTSNAVPCSGKTGEGIDEILEKIIGTLPGPKGEKSEKLKIGLFHGPIEGSSNDFGFVFDEGYSIDRFIGCDVVLAGDIHKRQRFNIPGGGKIYMVGSMIIQNFGESIKNHGYGVYNVETNKYRSYNLENTQPYLNFKITDIEDINKEKEILING